jgi:hypothetical protein
MNDRALISCAVMHPGVSMKEAELPRKIAIAIGIMFVTAAIIYFAVRVFALAL